MTRFSGLHALRHSAKHLVVLFAVAFIYLLPGITQQVNPYDEGVITYGAVRVLHGDLPYRDFWTAYPPGPFYATAAVFKMFGTSILAERIVDTITRALIAVLAYLLTARLTSRAVAVWAFVTVTIWTGFYCSSYQPPISFYSYPAVPAIALCLASIWAMNVFFETDSPFWASGSGAALGLSLLFKHDVAAYCAIGQIAALLASRWALTRPVLKTAALFVGGVIVVVLPVAIFFLIRAPWPDLKADLIEFPTSIYPRFRWLPYPDPRLLSSVPFYFPFFAFAFGASWAVRIVRRHGEDGAAALTLGTLIVFGLLGFNSARIRSDVIHTMAFMLPALIVAACAIGGLWRAQPGRRSASAAVAVAFGCIAAGLVLFQPLADRLDFLINSPPASLNHGIERAQFVALPEETAQTIRYIRQHTSPDERIFVGVSTHDRVLTNEPILYFLADRRSATRYHDLHPGVVTTAPVQDEMTGDLERYGVTYVILSSRYQDVREPNESSTISGLHILDNYIATHYERVAEYGFNSVWRRK